MNWGLLILAGLLVGVLAQMVACVAAFRHSALDGVLSLFIPGHLFLALKRSGAYWPIVGTWFGGIVAVVVGTIALS